MSSFKYNLIDFMKTNDLAQPLYIKLKKRMNSSSFKIESLRELCPIAESGEDIRYNLVLPSLRTTRVFGGILTAIKTLKILMAQNQVKGRIIVLNNERFNEKWTYEVEGFSVDKSSDNELLFLEDRKRIEVKHNDIFILTSWKTAYSFMPVLDWQYQKYDLNNRKALYLIQDYEPGFYPWSSEYILAESTYKTTPDRIIALYNSKELYEFFRNKQYYFSKEFYFEPALNDKLKKILFAKAGHTKRKKQILIYGRQNEHRNAFEILKGALAIWSEEYEKASEWNIVSLGETFDSIKLKNNTIVCGGKVSLEKYAGIMLSSYVGVSLMISPHPSYPPLEMSSFGIKTITNKYENKDLSYFNNNIVSIDNCTPRVIAAKLTKICDEYENSNTIIDTNSAYFDGSKFDDSIKRIGEELYDMVEKN